MEFLFDKVNDNIHNIILYLDYNSYNNLINTQKTFDIRRKLIDKKDYYKKYSIRYNNFNLAWKDSPDHWELIDSDDYYEKYYKLNYVWWFELGCKLKNLNGKYRFTLYFNKGNLKEINYVILINGTKVCEKISINLSSIPYNTCVKVKTNYITITKNDLVNVIFYETLTLKQGIEIYYIEYI